MIEILRDFPDDVLAVVCHGQVTQSDYKTVLIPAVEKKLEENDKVRLYYETAADFTGIDPGAVWEDFMTGMEHYFHWGRVAVVTDVDWIRLTMQAFAFMMPAEMKVFPGTAGAEAKDWLVSG